MNLFSLPESSVQLILFFVFCLTVIILLWYYLYYFSRIAFYKDISPSPLSSLHSPPMGEGPGVRWRGAGGEAPASVIICAKNEDHNLPEFLPLFLSQDYPEYEVVVVNDCSWDNTTDVLREFEKKYKHLKVITIKEDEKYPHGKKFALMVGIKGAKYEHLLFTDADCKPPSNQWLKKMMRNFSDKTEIVLGYSKYEKHPGWLNKFIRFDTFHIAMQYLSYAMAERPYMGTGRNLSYKKNLFFRHKGFATHYHIESGDDDLFINQAATKTNTRIEISPESFTVSRVKKDWKGWVEQKRRHLTTWKEYKLSDKIRLGVYPFAQVFFWLLFVMLLFFPAKIAPWAPHYELFFILALFTLKIVIQMIIFKLSMNKLQEKDLLLTLLFIELFLLGFYPALTISNWLFHRKKWK